MTAVQEHQQKSEESSFGEDSEDLESCFDGTNGINVQKKSEGGHCQLPYKGEGGVEEHCQEGKNMARILDQFFNFVSQC